ncbi:MAG: tol-pal system protein YbgF [Deltaproteobacteria bacterium]|nr:tol-pal system protein YbgF [Deltaproteobacteria bacterium]
MAACTLFGGSYSKPVERAEFDELSGRVGRLEELVKSPTSSWAPPPIPGVRSPELTPAPASGPLVTNPRRSKYWTRYQRALSQVRSRRYAEAAAAFEAMLAEDPTGPLAPNARYWLGECFYARGDFSRALSEFQQGIVDYPSSAKAPDYLLKMSYSQSRLGDGPGAMESMRRLLDSYPNSDSARLVKSGRSRF